MAMVFASGQTPLRAIRAARMATRRVRIAGVCTSCKRHNKQDCSYKETFYHLHGRTLRSRGIGVKLRIIDARRLSLVVMCLQGRAKRSFVRDAIGVRQLCS